MHPTGAAVSHLRRAVKIGAMTLLVISALLLNLGHLKDLLRVDPPRNEFMALHDQRFELLRDALPKRGTVGYLSDAASWTGQQTHLLLAQFALAPLILVEGADQPLVVGEFSDPAAVAKGPDLKLTVVRDLGDGLVLFARPSQ